MFQTFPENADISPSKRVKFGIDPTFPRLHLGHLVPLRHVKEMMNLGHEITIVLGTFTAQLGDPSGRDTTRPILSEEEVGKNAEYIFVQIYKFLGEKNFSSISEKGKWTLCKNNWLHNQMRLPQFMKLVSKFTLSYMTSRNAFQERIANNQSIGLHELLVPVCQGWDSVALNAEIEVGGQDQLFNFQVARQMQLDEGKKPQACIMMPIINGTDGRKMSKSLGNCIFLDEDPKDIFGKVMSIPDSVMEEWFPLFTSFTIDSTNDPMENKKKLAREIVTMLHSSEIAIEANQYFVDTIQNKELPEDIPEIQASTLLDAVLKIDKISKTAARKLIEAGAVRLHTTTVPVKIFDEKLVLESGQVIQCGKRRFARII